MYSCRSCPSPHQKQSPSSSPHPQEGGAQPSSHAGRRAAGAGSSSPPAVGSYGGAGRALRRQPLRAAPPPPPPAVGSYGGARRARRRQPLRAAVLLPLHLRLLLKGQEQDSQHQDPKRQTVFELVKYMLRITL